MYRCINIFYHWWWPHVGRNAFGLWPIKVFKSSWLLLYLEHMSIYCLCMRSEVYMAVKSWFVIFRTMTPWPNDNHVLPVRFALSAKSCKCIYFSTDHFHSVPKISSPFWLLPITNSWLLSKKQLIDLCTVASGPVDVTSSVSEWF
jgi:hypothetical protein